MEALSRRRFLKISAAPFGAGAAAAQIHPLTRLAHAAAPAGAVKTIPTTSPIVAGALAFVRRRL